MARSYQHIIMVSLIMLLAACQAFEPAPTPTPTRQLSAPTLAPTTTIAIRTSGQLYGSTNSIGQSNLTAQALPNNAGLPPIVAGTREPGQAIEVQITLDVGRFAVADLYQAGDGFERVPAIMLLGESREGWGDFPRQISAQGFTVLVVERFDDLTVAHTATLLNSFSEVASIDRSRLSLIGAGRAADLGLLACLETAICEAAVLLSPVDQSALVPAMQNRTPPPLYVVAAQDDPESFATGVAVVGASSSPAQFVETGRGRGAATLRNDVTLASGILAWLVNTSIP